MLDFWMFLPVVLTIQTGAILLLVYYGIWNRRIRFEVRRYLRHRILKTHVPILNEEGELMCVFCEKPLRVVRKVVDAT